MAIRTILTAPDPRLKKKSQPVDSVDADVRRFIGGENVGLRTRKFSFACLLAVHQQGSSSPFA